MTQRFSFLIGMAAAFVFAASASAAETVKIAFIDPLSGPMAQVGNNLLHSFQYVADLANQQNWSGGPKLDVIGYDNHLSAQDSLTLLNRAADEGIRYVVQGNGSSVGLALEEAVGRYNVRNPGKEIIYLNYAAIDPAINNSKCNYWEFSFDSNVEMKMEAMTFWIAKNPKIRKVYLIDQDYSFGHDVSRSAREGLARKRPDIQIVGDDFHPLAQVKDFSPYATRIKASGADAVITGNWGSDLALLVKAAKDAGVSAEFYTYYANSTGVPTAMGAAGVGLVKYVGVFGPNNPANGPLATQIVEGFRKKYDDDFYVGSAYSAIALLSKAFKDTKSTDPVRVARALENMRVDGLNGPVVIRASDHQAQSPLTIATWVKAGGPGVKYDQEKTGYGWKTDTVLTPQTSTLPTTCRMPRPD